MSAQMPSFITFPPSTSQQKEKFTKVHPHISWGNPHTSPSTTHLHIVFQNCNTLSKDHFTCFSYLKNVKLLEPHIVGLAETNLNWSHFHTKTSVYSSLVSAEEWPVTRTNKQQRKGKGNVFVLSCYKE